MSAISVRLPQHYHRLLRKLAKEEGVSINQLIVLAIGEKISAIETENYLAERGMRGDRQKFLEVLEKVADIPPMREEDRID